MHLYAMVEHVNGTTLTLDRPAPYAVASRDVYYGAVAPALVDLTFDGNRQTAAPSTTPRPVMWSTGGHGTARNLHALNAESAFYVDRSTMHCAMENISAYNCGRLADIVGSAIWLFRGVEANQLARLTILGPDTYNAVQVDDRTSSSPSSSCDAPCVGNQVDIVKIDTGRKVVDGLATATTGGIVCVNSTRNTFANVQVAGVRTALICTADSQVYRHDGARTPISDRNGFQGVTITDCWQPWSITAAGNTLIGVDYDTERAYGHADVPFTAVACSPASW